MKWKTTLVLLVVAAALGLYLYLFERGTPTTAELEERRQLIFNLSADEVDWLHVEHGEVTVTLKRSAGEEGLARWRMTEPLSVRADTYLPDQVARDLESLEWENRLPGAAQDPEKLAQRGLEEPRASLSFRHGDTEEVLHFGQDTPIGGRVFLRVEGRPDVYEVRKSLLGTVLKEVNDFRDADVLSVDQADVRRLSVRRRDDSLSVERQEDRWRLTDPVAGRADGSKVEDALKKLDRLRVERFVADAEGELSDDEKAAHGLTEPVLTAELEAAGETVTVAFGSAVPEHPDWRYATTSERPSVYAVAAEAAEYLARPLAEFRDRQLTRLEADRIERLSVVLAPSEQGDEEERIELAKEDGVWQIRAPREVEADGDAVEALLEDVSTRQVLRFESALRLRSGRPEQSTLSKAAPANRRAGEDEASVLSTYGLDRPQATITLEQGDGREDVIQVGGRDEAGGRCYARRADDPAVLVLDEDFLDLALRGYLSYRTKVLAEVAPAGRRVTGLVIDRQDEHLELTKEKDEWQLTAPVRKRAERGAVDDLLFALSPLRADRILTEEAEDPTEYGLQDPTCRLKVTVQKEGEEPQTRVVSVGRALPEGGRAARVDADRLVGAVSDSFVEDLQAEFRYRTVLSFDRDQVDELRLAGVEPAVRAVKVEGSYELVEPADGELDEAKVESILNELRGLRVERWETYETQDLSPYGLEEPILTVSVHVGGLDSVTHVLTFGEETGAGNVFARLAGDPGVFELRKRLLEKLKGSVLAEPEEERAETEETGGARPEPPAGETGGPG